MDVLLVTLELVSIGVAAEAIRANIDWTSAFVKGVGHFGPKFYVQWDIPHQPLFMSVK